MCLTKTGLFALAFSLLTTTATFGQDRSKGDVAFSYSILHDSEIEETFPTGWLLAVNGNISRIFSVVGEVGGNYKTIDIVGTDVKLSVHSFMGGLRLRNETPHAVPFAQFLVGGARGKAGVLGESASETSFALQPGGGVDIQLTDRVALRVQGDYRIVSRDETSTEFRFAVGAVIGFGSR